MARATKQRSEILGALGEAPTPVSAQDLFVTLRGEGSSVALATVYRQLQRLSDEGVADRLVRDSGELAFRLCGTGHHHHLVCRDCGRTEEVRDCRLERWAHEIASEHGFAEVSHMAEFSGVCRSCAAS